MKTTKTIYWVTTGLFSLLMAFSAIQYLTNPEMVTNFAHLGFPDYFRVELALMKFAGVAILLIPALPFKVKEWAYAGFGITLISAAITHGVHGDPTMYIVMPLVFLGVLALSNVYLYRLESASVKVSG